MTRRTLLSLVVALSGTQAAAAQTDDHLLFVTGTLGLGDCGGTLCGSAEADTGASLGLGAGIFVRPVRWFAAGLDLHYNHMSADDRDASRVDEDARYLLFGLSVRGILPLGQVEPWLGLGGGYGYFGYFWSKEKKDEDLTVDGAAVSFALGVDVAVTSELALGGVFRLALPDWADRCRTKIETDKVTTSCRDVDTLDADERDELPDDVWYLGITVLYGFL